MGVPERVLQSDAGRTSFEHYSEYPKHPSLCGKLGDGERVIEKASHTIYWTNFGTIDDKIKKEIV